MGFGKLQSAVKTFKKRLFNVVHCSSETLLIFPDNKFKLLRAKSVSSREKIQQKIASCLYRKSHLHENY